MAGVGGRQARELRQLLRQLLQHRSLPYDCGASNSSAPALQSSLLGARDGDQGTAAAILWPSSQKHQSHLPQLGLARCFASSTTSTSATSQNQLGRSLAPTSIRRRNPPVTQYPAQAPSPARQPLSEGMDRFKKGFYEVLNSPARSRSERLEAVSALAILMQQGLQAAAAAAPQAAQGSPQAQLVMPHEYQPDLELVKDAFLVLHHHYTLAVEPPGPLPQHWQRIWRGQEPSPQGAVAVDGEEGEHGEEAPFRMSISPAEAQELARTMEALLKAMQATPGLQPFSGYWNQLLCALSIARVPEKCEELFQRMAKGELGAVVSPNMNSCTMLFRAFRLVGDPQGMLRALKATIEHCRQAPANAFINMVTSQLRAVLLEACGAGAWDVVAAARGQAVVVQKLIESVARAGQPHLLGRQPVSAETQVTIMTAAARADHLETVLPSLKALASSTWAPSNNWRGTAGGHHQQLRPGIPPRMTIKVEQGAILEVLNAAARAENRALGKQVAQEAWSLLKRSLAASSWHPPSYYASVAAAAQASGGASEPNSSGSSTPASSSNTLAGSPAESDGQAAGSSTTASSEAAESGRATPALPKEPPPVPPERCLPTTPAYHAYITALCRSGDWGAAFDVVDELEKAVGSRRPLAVSAHRGLAPFAEALAATPGACAVAYDSLARRQVEGKSVSVALMNLVLRGLALQGAVEQCGRLFEEYKVAGLPHDLGSFNAVVESCCVAGKPGSAYGVLDYMAAEGVQPSTDTFDILIRGFIQVGDANGAREALVKLREAQSGARPRYWTLKAGVQLAKEQGDHGAAYEFQTELDALLGRPSYPSGGGAEALREEQAADLYMEDTAVEMSDRR